MKSTKKFQADIPPRDEQILDGLMRELEVRSNADFLTKAIALLKWAVDERKKGYKIFTASPLGHKRELLMPELERIAPELETPWTAMSWTAEELDSFGELAKSHQSEPSDLLIRAMARR